MNKLIIVIILFCINYKIYASLIYISGNYHDYFNQTITPIDNGDPNEYNIFNLFDNNLKTAVALNLKYRHKEEIEAPFFRVIFKNKYNIDRLVIYNGFQFNDELYKKNSRAREIKITFFNKNTIYVKEGEIYNDVIIDEKGKERKVKYENSDIFITNCVLLDTKEKQIVEFPEVKENNLKVDVISVYPGAKYDDICLSKIEFWDKGEKYKVSNLEEAKKEYVKMYINDALGWFTNGFNIYKLNNEGSRELMKITGWNIKVEEIHFFHATFGNNGSIIISAPYSEEGKTEWFKEINVGNWKFDGEGRLWIKLKNGQWKFSRNSATYVGRGMGINTNEVGSFLGTDLECWSVESY